MPGYQMWNRRAAERRQVHSVQCADARADRGGELSVLHDRSERRRRAGAGSAAGAARGDREAREDPADDGRVRGHRRPRRGRLAGRRARQQFLAHIREVDAIAHVVRCFENTDIVHVAGKIDPIADIETIDTELALADLASVEKARGSRGEGGQRAATRMRSRKRRAVRAREGASRTGASPCAR